MKKQLCKVCEEELKLTEMTTINGKKVWAYMCACNDMIRQKNPPEPEADRIATLEAELSQIKAMNYKLLDDCEKEEARAEKAEAQLAEAIKTYTDENGTVWTVPTAWAYAQACNGRNTRAERAEALVRELVEALTDTLEDSYECLADDEAKWGGYRADRIKYRKDEIAKHEALVQKAKEAGL